MMPRRREAPDLPLWSESGVFLTVFAPTSPPNNSSRGWDIVLSLPTEISVHRHAVRCDGAAGDYVVDSVGDSAFRSGDRLRMTFG
jgi:hypothetical protein